MLEDLPPLVASRRSGLKRGVVVLGFTSGDARWRCGARLTLVVSSGCLIWFCCPEASSRSALTASRSALLVAGSDGVLVGVARLGCASLRHQQLACDLHPSRSLS
ncbi:hypothetical protein Dimus_006892 [Dionaea muscipula]